MFILAKLSLQILQPEGWFCQILVGVVWILVLAGTNGAGFLVGRTFGRQI
jgi:hypothetical protein